MSPKAAFDLIYTGPVGATSANTTCTASNTASDATWSGSVPVTGGTVPLTAPAIASIYSYAISCVTTTSANTTTSSASAYLYDGVPIPVPTDCGVTDNFGTPIPTLDLLAPDAVVTTDTAGLCLLCSVTQPENVVDQDPTDYATLNKPVGVAGSEALTVTSTANTYLPGYLVGFVASDPAELLTLELLQGFTVNTYLDGVLQDAGGASASNPLRLDLLTLLANPTHKFIGFTATKSFNAVQIVSSGLVSVIGQANVYQACVSTQPTNPSSSSSSSSSGGSSSSSSSSGSSSSSSSSSGSSSSSSGSTATAAPVSISVSPNPVTAGGTFTLTYTGPGTSSSTCTASNTAGDAKWTGTLTGTGGSVTLTAPTTPNVYSYSISCSAPTGGVSSASANLYDAIPAPIATDCGVKSLPTQSLTDANASVSTGSGGLCLFCSVTQPQNVLNQDPLNYASVNTPVALLGANEFLTVTNNSTFSGLHTAGFIASNPSEVLTLALLQGVTVNTLLNGVVQETAGTTVSTPLRLNLLTLLGNPAATFVSFSTTKPFNGIQLTDSNLVSVLGEVDLYQACVSTP